MRTEMLRAFARMLFVPVGFGLIVAGCSNQPVQSLPAGNESTAEVPQQPAATADAAGDATSDLEALRAMAGAPLSPKQVLAAGRVGQIIRWPGTIQHIDLSREGACLTVLYLPGDEYGAPDRGPEPTGQVFVACTKGHYDKTLVAEWTDITIVGRVSDVREINMGGDRLSGPEVEIERLYRWSDCLSGDTDPVCRSGFVNPSVAAED